MLQNVQDLALSLGEKKIIVMLLSKLLNDRLSCNSMDNFD